MEYTRTSARNVHATLRNLVNGSDSLLDVGSGLCLNSHEYNCKVILALEVHRPYLEKRKNTQPHLIPINEDAMNIQKLFLPKTVSTVLLNDVIEHFPKDDGLHLLQMCEEIANKRVVVFTPRGFFPQKAYDHFDMGGESYQEHRSGWEPEDFTSRNYNVTVFENYHDTRNSSFVKAFGTNHAPVDALLAWKECGQS
ncbi:hypothetical protein [Alicyclobacillus sp. SO9]|uniref:hypothetical protein n=1 Tax=Alicyclobacillus sp. SO9 TaxID=2665646 RepID=UPI0018E77F1D|nr:hypothetical protein [Alicyclobacillus sp. SO9]QQE80324.1 hypothetical protein GI364_07850 [Alicyclobacillus sp. SO9]